jgi:hypothetical protein
VNLLAISFRWLSSLSPNLPSARRRSARRNAIVAFTVGLAVVAVVQLAIGWAIRTNRAPLRDPIYTDKLETLRNHPGFATNTGEQPQRLLFIGSSRTLNGINAGAAEAELTKQLGRPVAAFNFASPGAGPVTNAVYLRRLLASGVKPSAVVIEVHPLLLAAQTEAPAEAAWFSPIRLRPDELLFVRQLGVPAKTPAAHGYRGWFLPLYEYRLPLIDRYVTSMSTLTIPMGVQHLSDKHGYIRTMDVQPEDRPKMLERAHRQYTLLLAGFRPGGCEVVALRDMLETCRTAGIRTALVLMPESSEFRSWYTEPGWSQVTTLLTELSREFACPIFNGREWIPDVLTADGHHLTGPGADMFTDRLSREALAPWLASFQTGGAP